MAANRNIAFATCRDLPQLANDDRPLAAALSAAGHHVEAAPWDDAGIDWNKYDSVIIRSTWNYHKHPDAFRAWIRQLDSLQKHIANPVDILEWNMDKHYLADLREADVPLPPTIFLEKQSLPDMEGIFVSTGWQKAVIKPCISATAYNTWTSDPITAASDTKKLHAQLQTHRYMIQEFMEEVESDGEYSLIFFGQQYSHAVKKTVKKGDFRVQSEYGGSSATARPDRSIIRQATAIIDKTVSLDKLSALDKAVHLDSSPRLLYARVDGVIRNDIFTLMELELVEPSLYINDHRLAVEQFLYFFNSSFTAAAIC